MEEKIDRDDLKQEKNKYVFDFQQIQIITSFGDSIVNCKVAISKANEKQSNLLQKVLEFNKIQRLTIALAKVKAGNTSENVINEIRASFKILKILKMYLI